MKSKISIIVGLLMVLTFAAAYPVTDEAIETNDGIITAGTTPDSAWYGLDVALDNINLAFTPRDKRAEKSLEIARERLLEVKQMISENKIEESLEAQEEHEERLRDIEEIIDELEEENATEEIERVIELEKEILEHKFEIEETGKELKLKIKIEGEMDEELQNLIDSIFLNLENSTGKVEIEIERKKDKTKIRIKTERGMGDDEIEREIKMIEERRGLENFEREKAEEMLRKANEKWADLEEKAIKYNQTIPEKEQFDEFIELGNQELLDELNEQAKDYYEQAKDYADFLEEDFEEVGDDEGEIEVEVEIEGGYAKVEVKALGEKIEFVSDKVNLDALIHEISERTGLSVEDISSNLRIREESGRDNGQDLEEEDDEDEDEDESGRDGEEEDESGRDGER